MAARHLVSHRDLSLLGHIAAHHLVHSRRQLVVAVLSGEHLHVYHDAVFAVRHSQGGISHLSGLLAEDGAQQPLLCGQLRLSLRSDLAYQDIPGADLGAHMDNAVFIQILQQILIDIGNVAGDLLRP